MDSYIRRTFEPFKWLGFARPFFLFMTTAKGTPVYSVTYTWEADGEEFSPATQVFRIPLTRWAVAFGYWHDVDPDSIVPVHTEDAEYEMYIAVNGDVDREEWSAARKKIAGYGLSPDEEMEVLQSLGLM